MRFFRRRRYRSTALLAIAAAGLSFTPASAKTAKECNAEYVANKAAIAVTQKRSAFIAACRADRAFIPQPGVPGSAALPAGAAASQGGKMSPQLNQGQERKPTAQDLADERKLKHDMNICIGC